MLKKELLQEFFEDKMAVIAALILLVIFFCALFPGFIAPQNPYDLVSLRLQDSYKAPGTEFLLGTDNQGRDIFSAILYGLRISLFVGITSTILSLAFGVFIGLLSGYLGKTVDTIIMRIADIQLSLPVFLIALVIMAIFGQGLWNIIIAISIGNWVYYARTARGMVLAEKEKDYVLAARSGGQSTLSVILQEIAPNIMAPVVVIATVRIANAILLEATLSFLGLGVPITQPSIGLLISNGYKVLFSGYWWMSVYPGIGLMILVLSINLMGDRMRDILNPRLKR